jgi:hypothetical protein
MVPNMGTNMDSRPYTLEIRPGGVDYPFCASFGGIKAAQRVMLECHDAGFFARIWFDSRIIASNGDCDGRPSGKAWFATGYDWQQN